MAVGSTRSSPRSCAPTGRRPSAKTGGQVGPLVARLRAGQAGEPGLGRLSEGFEYRGCDRIDAPAVPECSADLGLSHAPRPPVTRFVLAEAHHEVGTSRRYAAAQALHETKALVVGKYVEQARVDDGVESTLERRKIESIGDFQASVQPPLPGFR